MSQSQTLPPGVAEAIGQPEQDTARDRQQPRSPTLRLAAKLFIPIILLLAPFADHHSRDAVWLGYSWHYLLFLAALALGGFGVACILARMVRNAPAHRRLPFGLILVATPLTVLLLLEAYLGLREHDVFDSFRRWGNVKSPFLGMEAAPNHEWEIRGVRYTTDANRFRTHVAPRVAPEDETLIVVIGGSSVFGYGLNDDETWPHRLEQKLRERFGPGITVLNAGNNCLTTLQQLFRFYLRVLPLEPDYVIHYGMYNDIRSADAIAQSLTWLPEAAAETYSQREYVRRKNKGKGLYFENSVLFDRLKVILENALDRNANNPTEDDQANDGLRRELGDPAVARQTYEPGVTWYLRNLDSLRALCEANDIRFVLVSFLADHAKLPPVRDVGFEYFTRELYARCEQQGVALVDLFPQYERVEDKADLFFEDHYHPSAIGAKFIAAHVADGLAPMLERELRRWSD